MAINKLVYNGEVKFDLSGDTVTPETLAEGVTAHNASGELIVGTMNIASKFTQSIINSTTFELAASSESTRTIDVEKTGYTPIGIIGLRSLYDARLIFYRWQLSGTTATVAVRNTTTSKLTKMQLAVQVLYVES